MKQPTEAPGFDRQRDAATSPSLGLAENAVAYRTNKKNLLLLVALRWVAIFGQITTISIVDSLLDIRLPIVEMGAVILFSICLNLVSLIRCSRESHIEAGELFVQLLFDVATLTVQLFLSGGATNPFVSLYLLQVILSSVLLDIGYSWSIVALSGGCFIFLSVFHRDIGWRMDSAGMAPMKSFELHVQGMFVCFALASVLLVTLVHRINRNLRKKETRLSRLRQHAAEQEHIVRMGLLASGAAHELSTPLATLSVILQDWARMPALAHDLELGSDIEEMSSALARCKDIVSRILLAAGEVRAEGGERTTIVQFLDALATEWRARRAPPGFFYSKGYVEDCAIVPDLIVKQTLFNILDNALEASPSWVSLEASTRANFLILAVRDKGPGFPGEILARFGKPYSSTKTEPGSGLGLFLAVNVVRKLGGSISPGNRADGGAVVELLLPVAAMSIEERNVRG